MPTTHRFALFRNPANPADRPVVFATLAALARHIHRARHDAGLELQNARLLLNAGDSPSPGVTVWTTDRDGNRDACLGWANLSGGDRQALQAALLDAEPQALRRAA